MKLETQRLILIPCTEEALQMISTTDEYNIGPHIDMYLRELKEDSSLIGWGVWLVINKEDNTIIGDIGFKGKPDSENTIEVGYGMIPSAQNKGYATEAVSEIIKWAFSFENVEKIVAECFNDNLASIRVLEKLQMKRTEPEDNMLRWELNKTN
ncbi:ribosomal-protein-alanine N-acetyltransferase [Ureibacillus xyleni]|uniref:Ribosomal-protein-alanine N-acetyltransferase n=1 Tax=Ureibacillus xyleni TaxID=614648 RepID=A0A285TL70_9BACL|nr:GNAT family N-acetyltransferase [Ureibacillus xyleni]SOC23383.1 ribosomal-protein-alanine N-acetyltransferase [Ureibacillus xyleni]